MSNNPNNYPDPQSPEGKSRAGRLYFSLLVVLFIFLGTVILIHQFGNNIVEKVQLIKFIPIAQKAPPAEAVEGQGEAAVTQTEGADSAADAEQSSEGQTQTAETPSESEAPAQEAPAQEAPADGEPAPEEGAH
jgi:hypothetical protein